LFFLFSPFPIPVPKLTSTLKFFDISRRCLKTRELRAAQNETQPRILWAGFGEDPKNVTVMAGINLSDVI
jgi:hypothetical protein